MENGILKRGGKKQNNKLQDTKGGGGGGGGGGGSETKNCIWKDKGSKKPEGHGEKEGGKKQG